MNARLWLGHAVGWAVLMGFIGVFAQGPAYRHLGADQATIKLSLRHAGRLLGECRELSAEELAAMPPTVRAPRDCPRERSPLLLEMRIDGRLVVSERIEPRGIHADGLASMYRRITVPAGALALDVRLKDHLDQDGFPWHTARTVRLAPAQVLVIDFDAARGGFQVL